ncbi:MAG: SH3 domain-containing protein [Treponema sp.]|nr:SH3 domain-containing protein [Treponema sp.]
MVRAAIRTIVVPLVVFGALLFSSCSRNLGYGVLFWSSENPAVPSGTVLRVHIRSNINRVWVVATPREFRTAYNQINRFEVPLSHLELVGSKRRALERAEAFAPYALLYAETLQSGLPIRETPDNVSRRVYRLREGDIIKILHPVNGQAVIGTDGEPLPGRWFRVLTQDGTAGYCFSFRLRVFEHTDGPLVASSEERYQEEYDPELERLLSRTWSPESFGTMVSTRRLNLNELAKQWNFDAGLETGTARIRTADIDRSFSYTQIRSSGGSTWRFEGTTLQMSLRNENTLAVQFTEPGGMLRTFNFVALPTRVDDIIHQETVRREALFRNIFQHGPEFTSTNFGTLKLAENGRFTWTGNMLLTPQVIPHSALGSGLVEMSLFLSNQIAQQHAGAFTMYFDGVGGARFPVNFMYSLDAHGLRLEHAPQTSMDGLTVVRRSSSPLVIYFFRTQTEPRSTFEFSAPANPEDSFDVFGMFDFTEENGADGNVP